MGLCERTFAFGRLQRQNKIFWIAILTDFAKQNQSEWLSKKNIIWRRKPPKTAWGLFTQPQYLWDSLSLRLQKSIYEKGHYLLFFRAFFG
jgi:hypothetical protein